MKQRLTYARSGKPSAPCAAIAARTTCRLRKHEQHLTSLLTRRLCRKHKLHQKSSALLRNTPKGEDIRDDTRCNKIALINRPLHLSQGHQVQSTSIQVPRRSPCPPSSKTRNEASKTYCAAALYRRLLKCKCGLHQSLHRNSQTPHRKTQIHVRLKFSPAPLRSLASFARYSLQYENFYHS